MIRWFFVFLYDFLGGIFLLMVTMVIGEEMIERYLGWEEFFVF